MAFHFRTLLYAAAFLVVGIPGAAFPQSARLGEPDPEVHKLFVAERKAHVGEYLPSGIEVIDSKGETVDLRAVLKGPAILFRIHPDCPPCEDILAMLRKPDTTRPAKGTAIVVLRTNDAGHGSMDLPDWVVAFHTADKLQGDGFLDGKVTPTTFYFDGEMKLVRRTVGTPPLVTDTLLRVPSAQ